MQKINSYVLVFGLIPTKQNEKDGMIQRELAIDSLINCYKRIYIEDVRDNYNFINYPRSYICNLLKRSNNELLKDNVKNFKYINSKKLYSLFKNAKFIYIHSLWSALKIPENIVDEFKYKIIMDIHGCVPEEYESSDNSNPVFVNKLNEIEKSIFSKINTVVAVSENMINFYNKKYPNVKTHFILLPIFNSNYNKYLLKKNNRPLTFIYSGGTQSWQKTDVMIDFILKIANKNYKIIILTPDVDYFKTKINLNDNIDIKTVSSSELTNEYNNADIGIIFRDDITVNKIACPTKMIDYLSHGLIPCVLQPNIGDFNKLCYKYLTINDVLCSNIPNNFVLEEWRNENFEIMKILENEQKQGILELKILIDDFT